MRAYTGRVADSDGLGGLLRAWRDRAVPTPGGSPERRRARGMRREELATRAGVSVDYVIRLEQGRATRPSARIVDALAAALGLSVEETMVLHRAAGLTPPAGGIERRVPRDVERLADRLNHLPVAVYSPDWWLLRWNPLWSALLGDPAGPHRLDRNLVWQVFAPRRWRAHPADRSGEEFQRAIVADLRTVRVDHPMDPGLSELVDALGRQYPGFARHWVEGNVARLRSNGNGSPIPTLGISYWNAMCCRSQVARYACWCTPRSRVPPTPTASNRSGPAAIRCRRYGAATERSARGDLHRRRRLHRRATAGIGDPPTAWVGPLFNAGR